MNRLLLLFCWLPLGTLAAQSGLSRYCSAIQVRLDTASAEWPTEEVVLDGVPVLPIYYTEAESIAEIRLTPRPFAPRLALTLVGSEDYEILDTLVWENDLYFRGRIRLRNLTRNRFPQLQFELKPALARDSIRLALELFPYTDTEVSWRNPPEELFIGEEYNYTLECNHPQNIRPTNRWITEPPIYYRLRLRDGLLQLEIQGIELGEQTLQLPLRLRRPWRDSAGRFHYELPPLRQPLPVKPARLRYLNMNRRELVLETERTRQQVEVELDYDNRLQPGKTYRIEAQEAPGGYLVAELFTRERLANGRMLCWLRPFDYHRRQDSYLYIKDGDEALYLTNIDLLPALEIERIEVQRPGQDWETTNHVYPGERVGIRLTGEAIYRGRVQFTGLANVVHDTVLSTENQLVFRARVPLDIAERNLPISLDNNPTERRLVVREFSRPHPLNFLDFRIAGRQYALDRSDPILFIPAGTEDITIGLRPDQIDGEQLYGPQPIRVEVEVRDRQNQLVDRKEEDYLICPERSPRTPYYPSVGCQYENISLNRLLRRRLFELDSWSTVRVRVRHQPDQFGKGGLDRTVEFVLSEPSSFDIDVSFPAGLVTKKFGEPGFGNLGGISMAMIAQFSFFKERQIAKAKPYKFGAGFLALNAFNFDDNNSNRDLGVVALASLYPIRTKYSSRLSFPLYLGGGYFLGDKQWFMLLGPGIRVRL
jgi:hypothetical protein